MRIRGHIHIRRSPATVFDFVADERNNYDPAITDVDLLTGTPIGVGSCFRCVSINRGRAVEMTVEVVEYDRPHRLLTTTHLDSMDITSSLHLDPRGDGTRLRWSSDLRPHGWLRPLTPLFALFGRRRIRAIWRGLKHTLETQPRPSPPDDGATALSSTQAPVSLPRRRHRP